MGELVLAGTAGLITGGGSGIGLAAARHLLRDGASVTLAGRSQERLDGAVGRPPGGGARRRRGAERRVRRGAGGRRRPRRRGGQGGHRRPPALRGVGRHRHRRSGGGAAGVGVGPRDGHQPARRLLHPEARRRRHGRVGRRRVRRAVVDRRAAHPPVHVGVLRVQGRARGAGAQRRRRARPLPRAGERRAAEPRAHRAGRPARAGPGGARRLPRQHADQPAPAPWTTSPT